LRKGVEREGASIRVQYQQIYHDTFIAVVNILYIRECQWEGAGKVRGQWVDIVLDIKPGKGEPGKFAPYPCCFKCCAPQAICQWWEIMEGRKSIGKESQFKDIIMPVVFCKLWVRDNWIMGDRARARKGGVDVARKEEVFRLLGQKII